MHTAVHDRFTLFWRTVGGFYSKGVWVMGDGGNDARGDEGERVTGLAAVATPHVPWVLGGARCIGEGGLR